MVPGERLRDARRRMDRGVRRRRPAVRAPLRGDRGARRAEGSALRHARRAARATAPASDELVGSWIARHDHADVEARFFEVGVAGTAVRSVDDIIADAHVTGARRPPAAHVRRRARLPRARARAEALAHAGPRTRGAPRLGEHTEAVRAALGAHRGPAAREATRRATGPTPAAVWPARRVRVLDLSQWLAGPVAATLLGDFGADVIMVELPGPRAAEAHRAARRPFASPTATSAASRSTCARREGRAVFLDLVRVERRHRGELPARHARALGPRRPPTLLEINPRLVAAARLGIRPDRPVRRARRVQPGRPRLRRRDVPERVAGPAAAAATGSRPATTRPRSSMSLGMLAALLRRDVDGQGQVVDTAMFEAVLRLTGDALAVRSALGIRRERAGGDSPLYPCSITVEAADGRFVAVSARELDRRRRRARAPGPSALRRSRERPQGAGGARGALPAVEVTRALARAGPRREPGQLGGGSRAASRISGAAAISCGAPIPSWARSSCRASCRCSRETPGRITGWSRRARIRQRRRARGVAGLCAGRRSAT